MPCVMVYPGGCGVYLCDAELVSLSVPLTFIVKGSFSTGIHVGHEQRAWVLCNLLPQCPYRGWDLIIQFHCQGSDHTGSPLATSYKWVKCAKVHSGSVSQDKHYRLHLCP